MCNLVRALSALFVFSALTACRIEIAVPNGGDVGTVSGNYGCAAGETCLIDVSTPDFSETFVPKPHAMFEFAGWEKKHRSFCSGSLSNCSLSTTGFSVNAGLMNLLQSDTTFYLTPTWRAISEVTDVADGTPVRESVLYFSPSRLAQTSGLQGERYESGVSISLWLNFTGPIENTDIISGSDSSIRAWGSDDGRVVFVVAGSVFDFLPDRTEEWYHVGLTHDGDRTKMYLDGVLVDDRVGSGDVFEFPEGEGEFLGIGGYSRTFRGHLKQLKIFNKALSEEEIAVAMSTTDSRADESSLQHQWLFNEGIGDTAFDTVGSDHFAISNGFWLELGGPFEIQHDKLLTIEDGDKVLSIHHHAFGVADLNQDGFDDLFYHGANDFDVELPTPMLLLENINGERFVDSSDTLIDGGLYFKIFPSARTTVVADFNLDGYDDIFMGQSGEHGEIENSEVNALLLSDGDSGKLYVRDETNLLSYPCILEAPTFDGQKPCEKRSGVYFYEDKSKPKVPININSNNHGTAAADIDRDGDVDIIAGAFQVTDLDPVQPYFLVNDGNGVFTADWQRAPNKLFQSVIFAETGDGSRNIDANYSMFELQDFDGDGYVDLAMFHSDSMGYEAPNGPFGVEMDYWDQSEFQLVAWGEANGFSEQYTILEKDRVFVEIHSSPVSADYDNDGDIDIIVPRQPTPPTGGQYLVFHRNEGDRVFVDATPEHIPQDRRVALTLDHVAGELKNIDLNGDGCIDLIHQNIAAGQAQGAGPSTLWLNNCHGYFTPVHDRLIGFLQIALPIDYDNDGDMDFVSQLNYRDGGQQRYDHFILERVADINFDEYIDTDRDGRLDVRDTDDDNDGLLDDVDPFPKSAKSE